MKYLYVYILLLVSAALVPGTGTAQPRSLGGVFSFSGAEVSYQHSNSESTFFEINAGIDFCGVLDGQVASPGVRAGFTYNFNIWGHEFGTGVFSILAGIGCSAGYVRQTGMSFGPMAGLAGKIAYAQFLHDGSEVKMRDASSGVHNNLNSETPDAAVTFELPVLKPNTEVPVIEIFLK